MQLLIFVFTLPDFREIGSKKSADSKKSGSGTTALGDYKGAEPGHPVPAKNINK